MNSRLTVQNVRKGRESDLVLKLICPDKRSLTKLLREIKESKELVLTTESSQTETILSSHYLGRRAKAAVVKFSTIEDLTRSVLDNSILSIKGAGQCVKDQITQALIEMHGFAKKHVIDSGKGIAFNKAIRKLATTVV